MFIQSFRRIALDRTTTARYARYGQGRVSMSHIVVPTQSLEHSGSGTSYRAPRIARSFE
jgi:hypothetical protein